MRQPIRRHAAAPAWLLAGSLILPLAAPAHAVNDTTEIVLHAVDTAFAPCDQYGFDCETVYPVVDMTGFAQPAIYVLLRNFEVVLGLQCAFDWDPSWIYLYGLWDCQSNQVNGIIPSAPGAATGTIATAFDAVSGPELAPIGRLHFGAAASGCLDIIESSFPFGTHVIGDTQEITPVDEFRRGRVCVDAGGYIPCDAFWPVDAATWGRIKSRYR